MPLNISLLCRQTIAWSTVNKSPIIIIIIIIIMIMIMIMIMIIIIIIIIIIIMKQLYLNLLKKTYLQILTHFTIVD